MLMDPDARSRAAGSRAAKFISDPTRRAPPSPSHARMSLTCAPLIRVCRIPFRVEHARLGISVFSGSSEVGSDPTGSHARVDAAERALIVGEEYIVRLGASELVSNEGWTLIPHINPTHRSRASIPLIDPTPQSQP